MVEFYLMKKNHISQVAKIEEKCFNVPWSKSSFERELKNKLAIYIVAIDVNTDKVVGFAGMWHVINEGHITNIAVTPKYRRQGIGERLLEKLSEIARGKEMIGLTLDVRVSNGSAKNLYRKLGFKIEGIRKEYYEDTREDALVMWKYLIDENLVENNY